MSDSENAAANRRLIWDLGGGALALLGLVALHLTVYSDAHGPGLLPRALIGVACALVGFWVSGATLYEREQDVGELPVARTLTAMGGLYLLTRGFWDLFALLGLPIYPWGMVAVGIAALAVSTWADSSMTSMFGAEFLDRVAATKLAAFFGFVGGYETSAVFFHALVAVIEIPLGWTIARRYRRALGLGLVVNGGYSLLWALLVLGSHGPALHGAPDLTWISPLYFLLALAVAVLTARLVSALGRGGAVDLSSRMVILTVSYILQWYGLPGQVSFLAALMVFWALQSTGALQMADPDAPEIALTPELLHNPDLLQEILAERAATNEIIGRMSGPRQGRHLAGTLALSLLFLSGALVVGTTNRSVRVRETFRAQVATPSIGEHLSARFEEIVFPKEAPRGTRLDCYLVPATVEGQRLLFWELRAIPRGEPVPDDIDPARAWKIPGKIFEVRELGGRIRRGVMVDRPLGFPVPAEMAERAGMGDVVVFAAGWTGYAYAQELVPAGGDDDAPDDPPAASWLVVTERPW